MNQRSRGCDWETDAGSRRICVSRFAFCEGGEIVMKGLNGGSQESRRANQVIARPDDDHKS